MWAQRPDQLAPRIGEDEVPASVYDERYFLEECEGSGLYLASAGRDLPRRLRVAMDLAAVRQGEIVADLGCGRGEVAAACAVAGARVWAVDYSPAALSIARRTMKALVPSQHALVNLLSSKVSNLPFRDQSINVVLMLDIVEHLRPRELAMTLAEVHRVLQPGGRLVVHTMPNRWYYTYGYPLFRFCQRLRGHSLPANPRDRWEYAGRVHVNEQDVRSLRSSLRAAGFQSRVWVTSVTGSPQEGPLFGLLRRALAFAYPLNLVFCNDLFAVARKPLDAKG